MTSDVLKEFDPITSEAHGGQHLYPDLDDMSKRSEHGTRDPAHSNDTKRVILIVGSAGSGKSSVGNCILGKRAFPISQRLEAPATTEVKTECETRLGQTLQVIDSPDFSVYNGLDDRDTQTTIISLRDKYSPDAILLTVDSEAPYTPQAFKYYKRLVRAWGDQDDFFDHLIVAFTSRDEHGSQLMADKSAGGVVAGLEVSRMSPDLQEVLKDARGRAVLFHTHAKNLSGPQNAKQIEDLFDAMAELFNSKERFSAEKHPSHAEPPVGYDGDDSAILIVGKTGNGKSSLGNIIIDDKAFRVGRGFAITTRAPWAAKAHIFGKSFKIVDTPDISNLLNKPEEKVREVQKWQEMCRPGLAAILLAIKCDVRYTPEEHQIYQELKDLWRNDAEFTSRLILAFTFGDRQDEPMEEELKSGLYYELSDVMRDSNKRFVVFDKNGGERVRKESLNKLHGYINDIAQQHHSGRPLPMPTQQQPSYNRSNKPRY